MIVCNGVLLCMCVPIVVFFSSLISTESVFLLRERNAVLYDKLNRLFKYLVKNYFSL